MSIEIEKSAQSTRIKVEGELTIFNAAELTSTLNQEIKSEQLLQFDLSEVTEIDAAGLQVLVACKTARSVDDLPMQIIGHSDSVQELFQLSNLTRFFGDSLVIESSNLVSS